MSIKLISKASKRKRAKSSKFQVFFVFVLVVLILYLLVAYSEIPVLSDVRNIWIETAMTTADHMWLAEYLFPTSVIDRVMARQVTGDGVITDLDISLVEIPEAKPPGQAHMTEDQAGKAEAADLPEPEPEPEPEVSIKAGDLDEFGNKIIVYDEEQDITIIEINGTGYQGRLMFVPDPSRVVVRHTSYKNVQGEFLLSYLKKYDGIAGINGNGFADPNGVGKGGQILGLSVAGGELWGQAYQSSASAGFTADDILMVGAINDPEKYNIRDMIQWGPAFIVNGEQTIHSGNTAGWGVQPRSAIGQTSNGTVVLATVDGRQAHSLGITVGTLSDVMFQYGCVNASLCDGGSSSIMIYGEEMVGIPSTPMKTTGRYLPNAIIVLKKD